MLMLKNVSTFLEFLINKSKIIITITTTTITIAIAYNSKKKHQTQTTDISYFTCAWLVFSYSGTN